MFLLSQKNLKQFDNDTLTKLLNAAKDFRNGKISEKQFDKLKDEILKSL